VKIGIVTFYRVANYGAMLQAYALWKYLEAHGHEVVFMRTPRVAPARLPLWKCFVAHSLRGVKIKLKRHVRHTMTRFASDFPQTTVCHTYKELQTAGSTCDAFIVGSDQMWNPHWCSGEHLRFVMLDFGAKVKKRIAYAVSFGTKVWAEDQNAAEAARLMNLFSAISVREESGVDLVRSICGRTDARCVLDPTLLYTADFYREHIQFCEQTDSYVFNYLLDEWSDSADEARVLAYVQKTLDIPVVKTDRVPPRGLMRLLGVLKGVSGKIPVPDWIARLAGAQFVVTNSFHGTVFAILFHRPFVSLLLRGPMGSMNERAMSLLNRLGLSNRAVYADKIEDIKVLLKCEIDWSAVDERLNNLRGESEKFLKESLSL